MQCLLLLPTLCLTSKTKVKATTKREREREREIVEIVSCPSIHHRWECSPGRITIHNPHSFSRFTSPEESTFVCIHIHPSSPFISHSIGSLLLAPSKAREFLQPKTQMRTSNEMTEQKQLGTIWTMVARRSPMRRSRRRGAAWRRCHARRRPCRTPPASLPASASPPSPC